MPHSGGGGSHGGGGHSGGGSHSSGGSHRSGSNSAPSPIRSTYYPGSSRYVYYHRGTPHYFYSNKDPRTANKDAGAGRIPALIMAIFFLCVGFFAGWNGLTIPKKLTNAVEKAPVIMDNDRLIDNSADLTVALQAFADKTGIVPIIATVHNEDWQSNYYTLENYAYELYLKSCSDESHVLIVYSQPTTPDPQFNDWYWELMQGDDTDTILNDKVLKTFNSTLQAALTRNDKAVGEDILEAFTAIEPLTMKLQVEPSVLMFAIVWIGITVLIFGATLKGIKTSQLQAAAQPIALDAQEKTCEYCGGKYIPGTLSNCPNCGAAIVYYANEQPVRPSVNVAQPSAQPTGFEMGTPLNYTAPQSYPQQPYQQQPYQQQPVQQQVPPNGNPSAGGSIM